MEYAVPSSQKIKNRGGLGLKGRYDQNMQRRKGLETVSQRMLLERARVGRKVVSCYSIQV